MKILLTNDDGIYAEGIQTMARVLQNDHQIALVAPDRERSASGHSITIKDPLRAQKVDFKYLDDINCFKVNGTPADCVKLGLEKLIDFKPDIIVSGINHGANLGYDVLYSGTVSAAIEAWMMGYCSLAVSLDLKKGHHFKSGANYVQHFLKKIENFDIGEKMLLNVNIPDLKEEEIEGVEITDLGASLYVDNFEERVDPMGKHYYWLSGKKKEGFARNTDIWAVSNDRIALTPLKIDLTYVAQKEQLQNIIEQNQNE
ncbi:MAG: 5'/3'-nucleotidase SurE [Bacillota bacterium]